MRCCGELSWQRLLSLGGVIALKEIRVTRFELQAKGSLEHCELLLFLS